MEIKFWDGMDGRNRLALELQGGMESVEA
jgi:hypothetical protein